LYKIGGLRDEITNFLYKKRLDEKLGESNLESAEEFHGYTVHQTMLKPFITN